MEQRFILFRRGEVYYCEDTKTRKQTSLHTKDKYSRQVSDAKLRTQDELTALLEGFELLNPGLVFISEWKPKLPDMLAGKYIPTENSSLVACVAKI